MALRNPIVVGANNELQALQAGDQVNVSTAGAAVRLMTNAEPATALAIGMPVYVSATNAVKRAQANAMATSNVYGIMFDVTTAALAFGQVAVDGVVTATTTQWDAVTGQTGGLTPNATYYLDPTTIAKLTTASITTPGQVIQQVGKAGSITDFEICIGPRILL